MPKPAFIISPSNYFLFKITSNFKTFSLLVLILSLYFLFSPQTILACGPTETNTAFGCVSNDPASLVNQIMSVALGAAGGVAFLMLVYGGFKMVFSQGNPETIQGAREVITGAIVGLLVVIFSVFFLTLIGINILGLPL